ncbi:MAG: hypothetical protein M1837_003819 [Sclerophora amabilis]|nr:MAG: hypothetical protein M1837_003819 [Sclerophora amabilis]
MPVIPRASDNGVTAGPIPESPVKYTIIAAFTAVAWYNVIELNLKVLLTFKRHRGLYFWSLLICSWGVTLHALAFVLKFFVPTANWVMYCIMITIGWYAMVTGQSVVLYSRLHLVVRNFKILRFVLIMICTNVVIFHFPTTVFTWGSNSPDGAVWAPRFNVMERIQMTGFCLQEFIISCIYIWATLRLLKPIYHGRTRKIMTQLIVINVGIILMDVALLAVEYSDYYQIEASLKSMVYSIKLKLEFAVLNQLMVLANTGLTDATTPSAAGREPKDRNDSVATLDSRNAPHGFIQHRSGTGTRTIAKANPKDASTGKWTVPSLDRNMSRNIIVKTQDVEVSSEIKGRPHSRQPMSPTTNTKISNTDNPPTFVNAPAQTPQRKPSGSLSGPTMIDRGPHRQKSVLHDSRSGGVEDPAGQRKHSRSDSAIELNPFTTDALSLSSSSEATMDGASPWYQSPAANEASTVTYVTSAGNNDHSSTVINDGTRNGRAQSPSATRPTILRSSRPSVEAFGTQDKPRTVDPDLDNDVEVDPDDDTLGIETYNQATADIERQRSRPC